MPEKIEKIVHKGRIHMVRVAVDVMPPGSCGSGYMPHTQTCQEASWKLVAIISSSAIVSLQDAPSQGGYNQTYRQEIASVPIFVFEEDEETALSRAEKSLSSREAELQKIREDLGAASSKLKESEAKLALSLTDIELRRKTAEDTARQMTVLREENKNMSQQIKTLVGLSNQLQNELNFLKQANQGPGPALRKFDLESEIK